MCYIIPMTLTAANEKTEYAIHGPRPTHNPPRTLIMNLTAKAKKAKKVFTGNFAPCPQSVCLANF
jgi:hypothetical protein